MMRRYLLVLDMDLLAVDEQLGLEPISYLLARQQEQPSEVVVLSLADYRQARLPALELLLTVGASFTKFPVAPQPGHDIGAAAGHRMNLAVRHLRVIGCQASGFISDDDLVTAVRTETRVHHYDQVILATGCQPGTWLARALRRDPARRLRSRLGQRLIVFPLARGVPHLLPAVRPNRMAGRSPAGNMRRR
jgi:selenocysteine lyase/cysteine desulfurase